MKRGASANKCPSTKKVQQKEPTNEDHKQRVNVLQQQVKHLKQELKVLNELREKYEKDGNHMFIVSEYENTIKQFKSENEVLEGKLENQNGARNSDDELLSREKKYQERIKQLENEKAAQLQAGEEEIRKQKNELMQKINALQLELEEIKQKSILDEGDIRVIMPIESEKKLKTQLVAPENAKETAICSLQSENKKLETRLMDLQRDKETAISSLQSENQKLKTQLMDLQRDKETSVNQKLDDDGTIQQLRTQIDELQKQITDGKALKDDTVSQDDMAANNSSFHEEIKNLQKQIEGKESKLTELQKENESMKKEISNLKSEKSSFHEEKKNLQKQIEGNESKLIDITEKYDKLKSRFSSLEAELKSRDSSNPGNEQKDSRIQELSNANMNAFNKLEKKDGEMKRLLADQKEAKTKIDHLASENRRLQESNKNLEQKVDRLMSQNKPNNGGSTEEVLKTEIQKLTEEKETLTIRLSKMAGAQLTYNNPNIADLGDENRPMKLSEKYTEIYDNEWTDAFEEHEKEGKSEMEVIAYLLHLLLECQEYCSGLFNKYKKGIEKSLTCIPEGGPQIMKGDLPVQLKKQLADICKDLAIPTVENIQKSFLQKGGNFSKATTTFVNRCVELCWLMSVQDPPVVIDCRKQAKSSTFKKDLFKHYTKSGTKMDYVVWPPLFLYQDGSLLAKGIAQPI